MSRKIIGYSIVLALLIALGVPLIAQAIKEGPATQPATAPVKVDPAKVVLTVGEEKITAADFDQFVDDLPPQVHEMVEQPGGKRMLAEDVAKYKLLAGEAVKRGLADSPKVKRQMAMVREQILAQTLLSDVQDKVGEAELKKWFEEHKAEYEQVKARHILIRVAGSQVPGKPGAKELTDGQAKAKAEDLCKRLAKGEDFAALAKAESDDTGSGEAGGDLGMFKRGQMVKPFEDVAFALKDNEISPPVKTQFGYHIIQTQLHRSETLEDVKETAKTTLGSARLDDLLAELRKANKTELDEAFFGPPAPAGMMMHPRE